MASFSGFRCDADDWSNSIGSNEIELVVDKAKQSKKQRFNALFGAALDLSAGGAAYVVTLRVLSGEKGNLWFGITRDDLLAEGWKCKGAQYGGPGNLSDGGGALRTSYGPALAAGDSSDLVITRSGDQVRFGWVHNKRSLGVALSLPADKLLTGPIFPLISFSDPHETANIRVAVDAPSKISADEAERLLIAQPETFPEGTVLGEWAFDLDGSEVRVDVSDRAFGYRIVNRTNHALQYEGSSRSAAQISPMGMSTKMWGPPELMEREQKMGGLVGKAGRIVAKDGKLFIEAADGSGTIMELHRAAPLAAPEPITTIRWL